MKKKIVKKDLVSLYKMMLKIRLFEEKIVELYPRQEIKTPVHLCIGQEAIAAGVCHHLKKDDYLFSNHRCHGHCIAKGMDLSSMMAELYGKQSGCCHGKGGSMHLADPAFGISATSAIVGGGIALAVGAALAIKFRKGKNLAVVFFGDGAADEGIFYESLNFASLKKLPVLFVCENNFYATNSFVKNRQPLDNIYKRGEIFAIPGVRCDGNDVVAVYQAAAEAVSAIRKGKGPRLLECRTYRWKAHVGPDCDVEKGCRPRHEFNVWLKKCPLEKYEKMLLKKKILNKDSSLQFRKAISEDIEASVKFGQEAPFPPPEAVYRDVYRES